MLDLSRTQHHDSIQDFASSATVQSDSFPPAALSQDVDSPDQYYIGQVDKDVMQLARTPTVAVFHKSTKSPGVPHAFGVFLRQVPALPQLVVSNASEVAALLS